MKNCWISPDGQIIEVIGSHYDAVFKNKLRYELTGSHFELARQKNPKDVPGVIITLLLGRGWIKVSFKDNRYLLEFDKWSLQHRGNIRKWMLGKNDKFKVELLSLDGKYNRTITERGQI